MMAAAAIAPSDPVRVMRHVLVVQTFVVDARDAGVRYYEIHFATDPTVRTPQLIALTRDRDTYERALAAEGLPYRFDATWHAGRRADRKLCQVLDGLVPATTFIPSETRAPYARKGES